MKHLLRGLLLAAALLALGCPPEPPPPPATPSYSLHLREQGPRPQEVVACIVSIRGCSPRVAEALVQRKGPGSLPVKTGLSAEAARAGASALERAGARAAVVEVPR